jgi:hypothetical protein
LLNLIKEEPEWAENQILHRDRLMEQLFAITKERDAYKRNAGKLLELEAGKNAEVATAYEARDAARANEAEIFADCHAKVQEINNLKMERDSLLDAIEHKAKMEAELARERDEAREMLQYANDLIHWTNCPQCGGQGFTVCGNPEDPQMEECEYCYRVRHFDERWRKAAGLGGATQNQTVDDAGGK